MEAVGKAFLYLDLDPHSYNSSSPEISSHFSISFSLTLDVRVSPRLSYLLLSYWSSHLQRWLNCHSTSTTLPPSLPSYSSPSSPSTLQSTFYKWSAQEPGSSSPSSSEASVRLCISSLHLLISLLSIEVPLTDFILSWNHRLYRACDILQRSP